MRVLLLSFYYPPDIGPGPLRAESIVNALHEEGKGGLEIHVLTTIPNRYSTLSVEAPEYEGTSAVTIRRFSLPAHESGMVDQSRAFISFATAALRATRDVKFDIVVATSSRLMTAAVGALIARRCEAKLYLDIRDLFTDTMQDVLAKSPFRLFLPAFRLLERWTFRSATGINVVSAGFLPHLRKVAPNKSPTVFTNGIDEEFIKEKKRLIKDKCNPLVVYAGNFGEGQGLHNILPKFMERADFQVDLRLIGDGGKRKILSDLIVRNSLVNVMIRPPVARIDLLDQYHEADVLFLHLNDYQAFKKVLPSKIFEYAATGKPILAGVGGYAAEFIREHVPGAEVFEPCDAEAMKRALERLLSGPREIDRSEFCVQYMRKNIMRDMAKDILHLSNSSASPR